MNKGQFLYRKWHLKVTETLSHMQGNPGLLRVLEGSECVGSLVSNYRPSSCLCASGGPPQLQPEGAWMTEEATE